MKRSFSLFWLGQTLSGFGSQISLLAIPTVAILLLHATPLQTGILGTLEYVWLPILGLSVGVLADRFSRRPILIVADITRGLALLCIPAALAFHFLSMTMLYVFASIVGAASVFFIIAYQSYLPQIVSGEMLVKANARLQMSESAAELTGMPLAGILIGLVGAARSVVADAASFFVSAICLWFVPKEDRLPQVADQHPLAMLQEGLAVVFTTRIIRDITICSAILNFGVGVNLALWLQYAYRMLHLNPMQVGFIGAFGAVGMLISSALAPRLSAALGVGKTLVLAVMVSVISSALIPLAALGFGMIMLGLSNFVFDLHQVIFNITQMSLRQRLVPLHLQGRLNATVRTVGAGVLPIGSLLGGLMAQRIGIYPMMFMGIICSIAASIFVLLSPMWSYRDTTRDSALSHAVETA